jgi:Big-like domain-containing protein
MGGMHLASAYSYTFTTRSYADTSPISINSFSPAANATCVSTTAPIILTFDEAPDASTVNSTNIVVAGPAGAVIPVTMSINVTTTQVVLAPTSPLPPGTITVTVSNVGDLADQVMTSPYTWSFSTACSTGGGGTGGTSTQYIATLVGTSGNVGQVTVDTPGNVTVQLKGATASETLNLQFCPGIPVNQSTSNCFSIGAVSTDANGNGA